jgi:nucleoside-diphosphate-sugar epimerase
MTVAVIFGGCGFIGCFFADYLVREGGCSKVYLYDVESYSDKPFPYRVDLIGNNSCIEYVCGDVRKPIDWTPPEQVDLIANFAAVHREPGHEDYEYFDTNIKGAENVTFWADSVGCDKLIFTSSISPYGISESVKDETTLPVPVTAYGSSKLVAEKIHVAWQACASDRRKLIIARPGVVFGPGEGGNVTRLVRAVINGYFVYMGNRDTRKAGIYVKELCAALGWVLLRQQNAGGGITLFNGSMNPGPSISEYVAVVRSVSGVRKFIPAIPYPLLLAAAHVIDAVARPLGLKHPFSPVRIRKLVRSNNILPNVLVGSKYPYRYTLLSAMQDWRKDCPQEWK